MTCLFENSSKSYLRIVSSLYLSAKLWGRVVRYILTPLAMVAVAKLIVFSLAGLTLL